MKVFRLLGLRRLRQQPLRAVLATISVAAGVSLAVAINVTTTSLEDSLRDFGRTLAGPAELRVIGASDHGGLPLETVAAAEAVDGVQAVVPLVQVITFTDRAGATAETAETESLSTLVLGVDCRAAALIGQTGCTPELLAAAGDRPLAISSSLAEDAGSGASLRTNTGRVSLDGVAVVGGLDALGSGDVVVFPLAVAQQRFNRPLGVDVAYVVPADGVDRTDLRNRLDDVVGEQAAVLTADEPPPTVDLALSAFLPLFYMLGLFGVGTGAVLVRNTINLSLAERRRQLAILGALGAAQGTVVGGAVAEAALLGVAGGLLGAAGGIAIAGPIVASLSGFTQSIVGVELVRAVPRGVVVTAVVLGALIGGGAAWRPARRALRLDVAAELSGRAGVEEAASPRLVRNLVVSSAIGVVSLAMCRASGVDGGLERWQAAIGPLGFLGASISLLFVSSSLAPVLIGRLARTMRSTKRAPWLLGIANLVREPRRTGIMAVAIASPIIVAFVTDGFVASAHAGISDNVARSDGFVSVSTVGPNGPDDGFLTPELLTALEAMPQVDRIFRGSFNIAGSEPSEMVAVEIADVGDDPADDDDPPHFIDGAWDRDRFLAGEVVIGPALARTTGARAGDTVTIDTPTGPAELPVLGVIRNGDFGGRNLTTTYEQLEALLGPPPLGFVSVIPVDGVSEAELLAAVEQVVLPIEPVARVRSSQEIVDEIASSIDEQMVPFRVMQQGLGFVAFVAVLSTLLLVGMQRTRETGLLAAVGASPPELRRTVLAEAVIVAGTAVVQSALFGSLMLWALISIIPVIIGFDDPYAANWATLVGAGLVAIVTTLLAAAWPAWRASRIEVLEALRYE